jgi:hypothetical protein
MLQRLSLVFILAAFVFGGYAVRLLLLPVESTSPEPAFFIELPVRDLGRVGLGEHQVEVHVTNPAPRPRQIMGMMRGCRETCCFGPANPEAVAVGPGATVTYPCLIEIDRPGPFSVPVVLFLAEAGVRTNERLDVRGVAIAPESHDGQASKLGP